jgi:UDP-3-O-[3-hydroxymyristoyl] glucosamine N-acyltransferase
MKFTAGDIAKLIQGTVEGDESAVVSTIAKIEEGAQGALSFLANPKYTEYIYTTKASVVIVNADFLAEQTLSTTLIRVPDAYQAFAKLLAVYNQHQQA